MADDQSHTLELIASSAAFGAAGEMGLERRAGLGLELAVDVFRQPVGPGIGHASHPVVMR